MSRCVVLLEYSTHRSMFLCTAIALISLPLHSSHRHCNHHTTISSLLCCCPHWIAIALIALCHAPIALPSRSLPSAHLHQCKKMQKVRHSHSRAVSRLPSRNFPAPCPPVTQTSKVG
eukprot:scaffold69639_cov19-Tisochrysis_lutea.AAC.1